MRKDGPDRYGDLAFAIDQASVKTHHAAVIRKQTAIFFGILFIP